MGRRARGEEPTSGEANVESIRAIWERCMSFEHRRSKFLDEPARLVRSVGDAQQRTNQPTIEFSSFSRQDELEDSQHKGRDGGLQGRRCL